MFILLKQDNTKISNIMYDCLKECSGIKSTNWRIGSKVYGSFGGNKLEDKRIL